MSYSFKIAARTRSDARVAIENKMHEVAIYFPDCAKAKDAILALFDSQPDLNAIGYTVHAFGGMSSETTYVSITQIREST